MSIISSTTSQSAPVICIENLCFDYPDADIILRSCDSHEFRVLKIYIIHTSPILGEMLISPNTLPSTSAIPAESEVDIPTSPDALFQTVKLPIHGAILFSLLSYVFPVPPILPSTAAKIMELLSVTQIYKMDIVLTRIRSHIVEQNPPFIRKETAYFVYSLAQTYGLRTEALQAARCTLRLSTFTIQELALEGKLDMMPGAALYELWKYHQRVQSNLTSDLEEFRKSRAHVILGALSCVSLTDLGVPYWLDVYISTLGRTHIPTDLDFIEFSMTLTEHIQSQSSEGHNRCSSCVNIPRDRIRAFWDTLTVVVDDSIAKAETDFALVAGTRTGSADQDRSPSDSEVRSPPKYSDMPGADIILKSSDLIPFRLHKSVLVTSSPFFRDMLSLPQPTSNESPDGLPLVDLSEDADVLNSLVSMLYPVTPDIPDSDDSILALLAAAQKYDMVAVQSSIRAAISRRALLSPTGAEAFRVHAIACSKRLLPETEATARLTLHYPMTFESLGEALRSFDAWELRDLARFRLSCNAKLSSHIRLFLDCRDEYSHYWLDGPKHICRSENSRLPAWLETHFTQVLEKLRKSTHIIPKPAVFTSDYLVALHAHIKEKECGFCMKVYALKGLPFLSRIRVWVELARSAPYPNWFVEGGRVVGS